MIPLSTHLFSHWSIPLIRLLTIPPRPLPQRNGHLSFLYLSFFSLCSKYCRGFAYIPRKIVGIKGPILTLQMCCGSGISVDPGSRRQRRTNKTRKKRRNPCFEVLDVRGFPCCIDALHGVLGIKNCNF